MTTIQELFLPLDEIEITQKETGRFIEEFAEEEQNQFKLQDQLFFADRNILIRKHRRFAPYPKHSHQFLEFNYMLSGKSEQIVNGKRIVLEESQLMLLDTNSEHELMALGEEDILINFLFKTKELNIDLLKNIDNRSVGLTYDFIMNAILGPNYHENYLILDLHNNPEIQSTLTQMILEFYQNQHLGNEIINAHSQLLFLQLSRVYHSQLTKIYSDIKNADTIISVLQKIEQDYQTVTLDSLAMELGYNRNYLSNLIKKKTQKTFKELVTEERLQEAHRLITATNLPIETIAEYVGFSNKTQFYKKFKQRYNDTPYKIRSLK